MHTKQPIRKELAQGKPDPQLPKQGTGKKFKKGGKVPVGKGEYK